MCFLALSPQESAETRVLALTNAAQTEINATIRTGLQTEGTIGQTDTQIAGLTNRQLSGAELADARNYQVGDSVIPLATSKAHGLQKGGLYTIATVDRAADAVTLMRADGHGPGHEVRLDNSFNKRAVGKALTVYAPETRTVSHGDQIRFRITDTKSDVTNGERGQITYLEEGQIGVLTSEEKALSLPLSSVVVRGIENGYAATAHAVQGETVDRVIVAMNATEQLASQKGFYVSISRARDYAILLTDNPDQLSRTIEKETGIRAQALDSWIDGRLAGARQSSPESAQDRLGRDRTDGTSDGRDSDAERTAERGMVNGPGRSQNPEKDAEKDPSKEAQDRSRQDKEEQQLSFFEDPKNVSAVEEKLKEIENHAERIRERNKEIER